MNLHAARILAVKLMQQHGLVGWSFKFDHARRRFGCCNFTRRVISLSKPLTFLNEEGEVRDTILHEIAHALTPKTGHGPAWKAMCVRLGAKPVRCFKSEEVVTPPKRPAPMQIGCPTCGWWADRHKRTNRKLICRKCRTVVVYRAAIPAKPPAMETRQPIGASLWPS